MKTQIKDIVIGIFAVIGFTAVVMGFTNQTETQQEPQQTYGIPESHVWEMYMENSNVFSLNKQTGEVRRYTTYFNDVLEKSISFEQYRVAVETKPKPKK